MIPKGTTNGKLSPTERLHRLRLARSETIGPVTFRRLIEQFGTAAKAVAALPALAESKGQAVPRICSAEDAQAEWEAARRLGAQLIVWGDPEYPALLAEISDAPPVFYAKGKYELMHRQMIGIVGARNASLNGCKIAAMLARDLGQAGLVIVSGLARGIDAAAHAAAIATGTIAAIAGGIDVPYPPEVTDLHQEIASTGLLISEMPPGTQPLARHFPRRNRIISGLAQALIVVEAAARSGSLITARLALEQGRDVFAVPGSPLDPRSSGSNDLLRQGASLCTEARDILLSLPATRPPAPPIQPFAPPAAKAILPPDQAPTKLDDARSLVMQALSPVPVAVDELARGCQLSVALVSAVLLELELAGRLERTPGQGVALIE